MKLERIGRAGSERASALGEPLGLQVWCQDEAGAYQAIPQPGARTSTSGAGPPSC